jgi:hypothetical protein
MNLSWLHTGMLGSIEAGLLSMLVALLAHGAVHLVGRRADWSAAGEIGRAFVIALVISAGEDSWNLFYLGIVKLESVVTIQRALEGIHDPAWLGVRVVLEFAGVAAGVMLGWLLWTGVARREWRKWRGSTDAPRR